MKTLTLLLAVAVAGCQTYEDAASDQLRPFVGQPVETYIVERGRTPTSVFRQTDGSTVYVFDRLSCGTTLTTYDGIVRRANTNCSPKWV